MMCMRRQGEPSDHSLHSWPVVPPIPFLYCGFLLGFWGCFFGGEVEGVCMLGFFFMPPKRMTGLAHSVIEKLPLAELTIRK